MRVPFDMILYILTGDFNGNYNSQSTPNIDIILVE